MRVPDLFINHFFHSLYGRLPLLREGKKGKDQVDPHPVIISVIVFVSLMVMEQGGENADAVIIHLHRHLHILRIFPLCDQGLS